MNDFEIGYLAGILDGEGNIQLTTQWYPISQMRITNTNLRMLRHIQNIWGGHISKIKPGGRLGTKRCWHLYFRYNEQQRILNSILPYLIIKKAEAEEILAFLEKRNPHEKHRLSLVVDGGKKE